LIVTHKKKCFFFTFLAVSVYHFYKKVWPYISQARQMWNAIQSLNSLGQDKPPRTSEQIAQDRAKRTALVAEGLQKLVCTDMENLHSYLRDTLNFSALEPFREKAQAASAQGKAAAKSIWNLLKISAVTYAVSAVYLVAMHDLMKRMQTGIVFRRNLSKDPQQKLALNAKGADEFMKLVHVPAALAGSQDTAAVTKPSSQPSSFLLKGGEEAGLVKLVGEVRAAVERVLGPVRLANQLQRDDIKKFIAEIRREVEGGGDSPIRVNLLERFLLPPEEPEAVAKVKGHNSDTLLDELRDIIEHPDFGPASQERLDAGFAHLEEKIACKAFAAKAGESAEEASKRPLAKLLAPIKDVIFRMFDKEEERKETLHILNQGPETASLLQSIFDEEVPDVETIDE